MKEKNINIAGKEVKMAYCYATEIGYKILSNTDISDYFAEVSDCLSATPQRMPDVRNTVYAIIAAIMAWYDAHDDQSAPITDKDIINNATPTELAAAIAALIALRSEFYMLPSGEPVDTEEEVEPKNG